MNENDHRAYAESDEIELDLRQILAVLKKWGKLIVIMSLVLALCAGVISKLLIRPVYQAKSLVLITKAADKPQANLQNKSLEDVVATATRMPALTMNNYQSQIKSQDLMTRVAELINFNGGAGQLAGMISTSINKDANTIEITVQNADPQLASQIVNTLAAEYQKMINEKDRESMNRSISFLQEQMSITDKELQTVTKQLSEFYQQPRGVAVVEAEFKSLSDNLTAYESRLKDVQVEVDRLYAGVVTLEQELQATPRTVVTTISSGQLHYADWEEANPLYTSLAEQLTKKRAELAEKQSEAGSLGAMIIPMKGQLDSLQAEMVIKKTEQDKLDRELQRIKGTAETLAKKEIEIKISQSVDTGDASVMVLSEATIPAAPVKPNIKLNIAIVLVISLMLFTLLAFVKEYLDNTRENSEDMNRHPGLQ